MMTTEITNEQIAERLEEISKLYSLEPGEDGNNPHRERNYRQAAETIKYFDANVADLEDVTEIRGVGRKKKGDKFEGIGPDIEEILATGTCERLERLRDQHGHGLNDVMRIPGVGPKTASHYLQLGITTADDVISGVMTGKLKQPRIVMGVESFLSTRTDRMLIDVAWRRSQRAMNSAAKRVPAHLLAHDPFIRAGSARRYQETVGDLDILIVVRDGSTPADRRKVAEALSRIGSRCLEKGLTDVSIVFEKTQVDFRIVEDRVRGSALLYFTGSKSFNEGMRAVVKANGMKLSYQGLEDTNGRVIASRSERQIFRALGKPFIPPAAREKAEDFMYFREDIVMPGDVTFDSHSHTKASDGQNSIREMRDAAARHGVRTLAITDHLWRADPRKSLNPKQLAHQVAVIRELNKENHPVRLLAGCEVDIMSDGKFAWGERCLRGLDWVVGAIHRGRNNVTERYLLAIRSNYLHAIAHPTGRLINKRQPLKANWPVIFKAAVEHSVAIEINCQPDRLDLKASMLAEAKRMGVKFVVSSDAHSVNGFKFRIFGIAQLQKAGVQRSQMVRK